jgi:hypothetical protein
MTAGGHPLYRPIVARTSLAFGRPRLAPTGRFRRCRRLRLPLWLWLRLPLWLWYRLRVELPLRLRLPQRYRRRWRL